MEHTEVYLRPRKQRIGRRDMRTIEIAVVLMVHRGGSPKEDPKIQSTKSAVTRT